MTTSIWPWQFLRGLFEDHKGKMVCGRCSIPYAEGDTRDGQCWSEGHSYGCSNCGCNQQFDEFCQLDLGH